MKLKVLISGAGIAGPALALALSRQRGLEAEVTVVERAPALRTGGQAVDFRGPVHREVLERLDLWDPIHARRTAPSELVLLDRRGEEITRLPEVMMAGDVEIVRGDLSRLLVERTPDAKYVFAESVKSLDVDGRVEFTSGRSERFDLIVGADGLHSGIRALLPSPSRKENALEHHGYRLATWAIPNLLSLHRRSLMFTVPGRAATISDSRAMLIFSGESLSREERTDLTAMRALIQSTYADVGWELPRLLQTLEQASDLYVDQIATVHVPTYSSGRVVLLGDAAWGGTLGGQGTPLAIVGAWVLANELATADVPTALRNYETHLRPYATECQKGARRAGEFFAPRTAFGLWARNLFYRAFTSRLLIGQFEKLVKSTASAFELPAYGR